MTNIETFEGAYVDDDNVPRWIERLAQLQDMDVDKLHLKLRSHVAHTQREPPAPRG